jgi:hypothetical protein
MKLYVASSCIFCRTDIIEEIGAGAGTEVSLADDPKPNTGAAIAV